MIHVVRCTYAPLEEEGEWCDGGGGDEVAVDDEDAGAHAGVEGQLGEEQHHHREHLHRHHARRQRRRLPRRRNFHRRRSQRRRRRRLDGHLQYDLLFRRLPIFPVRCHGSDIQLQFLNSEDRPRPIASCCLLLVPSFRPRRLD